MQELQLGSGTSEAQRWAKAEGLKGAGGCGLVTMINDLRPRGERKLGAKEGEGSPALAS